MNDQYAGDSDTVRDLKAHIKSLGLDLYGFASGERIRHFQPYYDERPRQTVSPFECGDQESRCQLSGSFLSVAFPYVHELTWPRDAHFSVYVRGRDYHQVAAGYLESICSFLRERGYSAQAYVDSNELPERLIAALAGLGWLGRSGLLITRRYGTYVFLGEIRTNLSLPPSQTFVAPGDYSACGDCTRCLKACPVGILGPRYVETRRCLSSVTQQKTHSPEELLLLDGRLFGCDTCQRVCPWNQEKAGLGLAPFKPYDHMVRPDLEQLVHLSKAEFRSLYAPTSAGWRGKAVLEKNALAALHRLGRLPQELDPASPLVRAVYDKLKEI